MWNESRIHVVFCHAIHRCHPVTWCYAITSCHTVTYHSVTSCHSVIWCHPVTRCLPVTCQPITSCHPVTCHHVMSSCHVYKNIYELFDKRGPRYRDIMTDIRIRGSRYRAALLTNERTYRRQKWLEMAVGFDLFRVLITSILTFISPSTFAGVLLPANIEVKNAVRILG